MGAGIQPCPDCGWGAGPHRHWQGIHTVRCWNQACQLCGPTRATEAEAVDAWNATCVLLGDQVRAAAAKRRARTHRQAKAAARERAAVQRRLAERQAVFL